MIKQIQVPSSKTYSVRIKNGIEKQDGVVEMVDGEHYAIGFNGPKGSRAKFTVHIDGKCVTSRVKGREDYMIFNYVGYEEYLEIPGWAEGQAGNKFTFRADRHSETFGANTINPGLKGTVVVRIYPEISNPVETEVVQYRGQKSKSIATKSSEGFTTLSGQSGQKFDRARPGKWMDTPTVFSFILVEAQMPESLL